jgi:hypothetical protein
MKHLFILTFLIGCFFLSCSSQPDNGNGDNVLPQIEISKLVTENGKVYLEVDGVPFPIYGAQIRLDAFINCDKMKVSDIEKYFIKGKELGLNCLQIPIGWNAIEPKENAFDFSLINQMMKYANTYDLKIELLWFSTNMIGDSFTYLVPQYILKDPQKRLYRNDEGSFWDYYGYRYALILNDKWILEREINAITRLFNNIRNTASLMLAATALGGGYNIYDLATSLFFINHTSADFADQIDHGVYTSDLQEKEHTESVRRILKGFIMAAPDIAKVKTNNIAAFNIKTNYPVQQIEEQLQINGVSVSFKTQKAAIGFVLNIGNYLLAYATNDAEFEFENIQTENVVSGSFNKAGNFVTEKTGFSLQGNTLNAQGCVLYKLE